SIVDDAKARFPNTVDCATTHGLAYRGTPPAFRQGDKMTGKTSAQQLAEILNLKKGWRVDREHTLQPRSQAFLILETVRRFAQSADENLSIVHVPQHGSLATASDETLAAVSDFAIRGATHIWGRMCNAQDSLPLGHDGYLKLWALSKPLIAADFIMLDEAQDTNPVVLEVLRHQSSQLVYVGDRYQQIYEWRGAINAMESMNTDITARLTQSFRFGPDIAAGASQLLRLLGEVVPLAGNPLKVGRIGPCEPTTILSRTNASVMTSLVDVLNSGKSPHLVGGTGDLMDMLKGVQDLKAGTASTVPDFFGFQTWEEVVEFAKSAEGEHLLTFTNLVQARGEKQLMWALRRTVEEDKADIILSTAHKSKGREWKNVRLTDDFMKTRPSKSTDAAEQDRLAKERAAEMRLLYVAITRAKENIDVPAPLLAMLGVTGQLSVPLAASAGTSPKPPSDRTAGWQPPVDWKEKSLPPQPSASIKPPKQVKRGLISRLFGW
ncbi:3'-5' exonuclease, partial [Mesorhizobium sp.]|uniref:3'-5' exonuclease n=1 Tax=Mesorhizobium sp. TaxID=1871066 RepID=UPI0026009D7C